MEACEPTFTRLDERVLELLSTERGVRARWIAEQIKIKGTTHDEVRGILRGMEHLGHVTGRGGWWRRLAHHASVVEELPPLESDELFGA